MNTQSESTPSVWPKLHECCAAEPKPKILSRFAQISSSKVQSLNYECIHGDSDGSVSTQDSDKLEEMKLERSESTGSEINLTVLEWENYYERAENFLEKFNVCIVSPSPLLKPHIFYDYLKAATAKFALSKNPILKCESALLNRAADSEDELNVSQSTTNESNSEEASFSLKLTKESSLLLKRKNLLKVERSYSSPASRTGEPLFNL